MSIEDLYSEQALAEISKPGGYCTGIEDDPVTGRPRWLENLDAPLELANRVLWAHSDARNAEGREVTGWEATLADLADSLFIRCAALEARLRRRRDDRRADEGHAAHN